MRICLWIITMICSVIILQSAQAGREGNGGDICENRFQAVRDDLNTWITNGGGTGLSLPSNISLANYNASMKAEIAKATVECTDNQILVAGVEKTCENSVDARGTPIIQCNRTRFQQTSDSDQYVLVHHEYAGLSGFEVNNGSESTYSISNQISGFLEDQIVKKLVVKPTQVPGSATFDPKACTTGPLLGVHDFATIIGAGNSQRSLGNAAVYKRTRSCTPVTGCGAWSAPTKLMDATATFVVKGSDVRILVSFAGGSPLDYEALYGAQNINNINGSVNGTGAFQYFGARYFSEVYLRSNCAKIDFSEAAWNGDLWSEDHAGEIAVMWNF